MFPPVSLGGPERPLPKPKSGTNGPKFAGDDGPPDRFLSTHDLHAQAAQRERLAAQAAQKADYDQVTATMKANIAKLDTHEFPASPDDEGAHYSLYGRQMIELIAGIGPRNKQRSHHYDPCPYNQHSFYFLPFSPKHREDTIVNLRWSVIRGGGDYYFVPYDAFQGKSVRSLDAICNRFKAAGFITQYAENKQLGHAYVFEAHPAAAQVCREFLAEDRRQQRLQELTKRQTEFETQLYGNTQNASSTKLLELLQTIQQQQPLVADGEETLKTHKQWVDKYESKHFDRTRRRYVAKNEEPLRPGISFNSLAYNLGWPLEEVVERVAELQRQPGIGQRLISVLMPQRPDAPYSKYIHTNDVATLLRAPEKAQLMITPEALPLLERCLNRQLTPDDFADSVPAQRR